MEGRKRAAAQSVTKHERIGEEIGDDRLQKRMSEKGCVRIRARFKKE